MLAQARICLKNCLKGELTVVIVWEKYNKNISNNLKRIR